MKNRRSRPFKRSNNRNNDNFANGNNNTRVRGNLSTVFEKYKVLAKDAAASGDYVGAENYLQHAEHYSRLINEFIERNSDTSALIRFFSAKKISKSLSLSCLPEGNFIFIGLILFPLKITS